MSKSNIPFKAKSNRENNNEPCGKKQRFQNTRKKHMVPSKSTYDSNGAENEEGAQQKPNENGFRQTVFHRFSNKILKRRHEEQKANAKEKAAPLLAKAWKNGCRQQPTDKKRTKDNKQYPQDGKVSQPK